MCCTNSSLSTFKNEKYHEAHKRPRSSSSNIFDQEQRTSNVDPHSYGVTVANRCSSTQCAEDFPRNIISATFQRCSRSVETVLAQFGDNSRCPRLHPTLATCRQSMFLCSSYEHPTDLNARLKDIVRDCVRE